MKFIAFVIAGAAASIETFVHIKLIVRKKPVKKPFSFSIETKQRYFNDSFF